MLVPGDWPLGGMARIMAGETGVDREGPSPPGPSNFISWVGPGAPNI